MTSMAAAWLSLAYGFGGMRSDGPVLSFNPTIPKKWKAFSFRVTYRGSLLEAKVDKKEAHFRVVEGPAIRLKIYGRAQSVGQKEVSVKLPASRVAE